MMCMAVGPFVPRETADILCMSDRRLHFCFEISSIPQTSQQMEVRPLFGGAVSLKLPSRGLIDLSRIRPVPDNQEVFIQEDAGLLFAIDILELVGYVTAESAAM